LHFVAEQGVTAFSSFPTQADGWKTIPLQGKYMLRCHIPANLLNEGSYTIRLLLVEDGTHVNLILEDIVGFDVKDLISRKLGSWHGREPGPVKPKLNWVVKNI